MNNKDEKKLTETYNNTIRNILMYAILAILLLATGIITHWIIFEFVSLAAAVVTIIYLIYLIYLTILKTRLKKGK